DRRPKPPSSEHFRTRLLCARCADCRLDVLDFFGWRKNGREAERLGPQFAGPSLRVVEMVILVLLDRFVGFLEDLRDLPARVHGGIPDQYLVWVILWRGGDGAFTGDELGGDGLPGRERHLDRFVEGRAKIGDDRAPRRVRFRIECEFLE